MTDLLSKALEKMAVLSPEVQDELAKQILDDIQNEYKWESAFHKSQDKLEELAKKAVDEYQEGKTENLGFDEL